jgi:hypothetical protein
LHGRLVELDLSRVDPVLPLRARLTDLAPRYRQHFLA